MSHGTVQIPVIILYIAAVRKNLELEALEEEEDEEEVEGFKDVSLLINVSVLIFSQNCSFHVSGWYSNMLIIYTDMNVFQQPFFQWWNHKHSDHKRVVVFDKFSVMQKLGVSEK